MDTTTGMGQPIEIRQRTIPEQLAYLAGKLREGDRHRESVALALEVLAEEMRATLESSESADVFPYRFAATDGMYAGVTFVYLDADAVISYKTDSPGCYFETWPTLGSGSPMRPSGRYEMTPEALARFNAIPERGQRWKA